MGELFFSVEPVSCNKLYIRLPVKIEDEFQVRQLHENIIQVHLPRQKSRRWCVIDFESQEKLEEAVAALTKVRINGKSIKVGTYKKGEQTAKSAKPKRETNSTKPLLKLLKKSA